MHRQAYAMEMSTFQWQFKQNAFSYDRTVESVPYQYQKVTIEPHPDRTGPLWHTSEEMGSDRQ